MMGLDGIGPTTPTGRGPARAVAGGAGFRLPPERTEALPAAPAAAEVTLGGILALQEAESLALRDREARRRGQEMLAALTRLQRALLEGHRDLPGLRRLAALAEDIPPAADPDLAQALAAVALRARVELARHETITVG